MGAPTEPARHALRKVTLLPAIDPLHSPSLSSLPLRPAAILAAVADPLLEMCARSSEALNPSAASRCAAGQGAGRGVRCRAGRHGAGWLAGWAIGCACACASPTQPTHSRPAAWTRARTWTPQTGACTWSTASHSTLLPPALVLRSVDEGAHLDPTDQRVYLVNCLYALAAPLAGHECALGQARQLQ